MLLKDKKSSMVDGFAGAFSGFATRILTAPFDVMKIRNQVLWDDGGKRSFLGSVGKIVNEEGISALWKGSVPAIWMWVIYSFIQFGLYRRLSDDLSFLSKSYSSLIAGSTAGNVYFIFETWFSSLKLFSCCGDYLYIPV
jgi:solute carrier family 25 (mitochondrial thiamine pyrophosphate transporter), member 19